MSNQTGRTVIRREIVRLDVAVEQSYEDFRGRFEAAVPRWNPERALELIERNAPWSEVVSDVAASAPQDFLLYWKLDLAPLMGLAGNKLRATEYLMGNHVIAETMYRHDPPWPYTFHCAAQSTKRAKERTSPSNSRALPFRVWAAMRSRRSALIWIASSQDC
ncbi:MAG TPA: hypothetical protein VI756_00270 [Blastocatellia bacterium]